MASDPEEMATVGNYEDVSEAELVCGLLTAAGLPAVVENHEAMHGVSETLPIEAHIRVLVPFADEDAARTILDEARKSGGTTDADVAEAALPGNEAPGDEETGGKGAGVTGTFTEV